MDDRNDIIVRFVAAGLVVAGGLVHLELWDGAKDFPNDNLGRMFLLNVVASFVAAVALVVVRNFWSVVAALGVTVGTLLAFGLSRTGVGVPLTHDAQYGGNFREFGFSPSPEAALALVFEIGAAAALVALLAWTPLPPRLGGVPAQPGGRRPIRR